tara:strand:+ start:22 stop:462 length:441 start_codon:yes stop_codon:yes gene_type:complete
MREKTLFFIIILTFYGCINDSKEIPACNFEVQNGLTYTDGRLLGGKCNVFYNDTLLWKTRTYKKGKLVEEIGYYFDGSIEYVGKEKDGKIDGDFISYYPNGQVSIEGELDMGKYIDEWKYYDDDGTLNKTLKYNSSGQMIDSIYHK